MDYFYNLDRIICEELDKGKDIAIYPFGKNGMQAKDILEQRYGRKAILIDNQLAKYNSDIVGIDEFLKRECENVTVLITATDRIVNDILLATVADTSIVVRNIMEPMVIYVPEKEEYFTRFKELCRVKVAEKYELVRIGGIYDGGYVMLDDFKGRGSIAYSFGIGDNIVWDKDMADRGAKVYCYDPTILELPEEYEGLEFYRIGIAGDDDAKNRMLSMETILKNNGHEDCDDMILKMDVEGAEWDFLEKTSSEILAKFSQMTFEMHDVTNLLRQKNVIDVLQKIRKTHEPVWVHANNVGGAECANGVVIPRLLEITFVSKQKFNLNDTIYNCPIDLDKPNVDGCMDVKLSDWGSIIHK